MKNATALSKNWACTFEKPYTGQEIEEEMAKLLQNLGSYLNYKEKIMGHIKSLAVSGDNCLQMSMTSLANVDTKHDSGWYRRTYDNLVITVNIIIYGFSKVQLENTLNDSLQGTIFS